MNTTDRDHSVRCLDCDERVQPSVSVKDDTWGDEDNDWWSEYECGFCEAGFEYGSNSGFDYI